MVFGRPGLRLFHMKRDDTMSTRKRKMGQREEWFDSWSEGPFTLEEVAKIIQSDAAAGAGFHTADGRTFREYCDTCSAKPGKQPTTRATS